jgi:Bacterial protein of unknown function (DUF885)
MDVADMRELSGRHEYDGVIQDLSPDGVRGALARLAAGAPAPRHERDPGQAQSGQPQSGQPQSGQPQSGQPQSGQPQVDREQFERERVDREQVDREQVVAAEASLRIRFGALQQHRWDPILHLEAMDLSCYDRGYAPEDQRAQARQRHAAAWPGAADAAIASLDQVSALAAGALLPAVRGLVAGIGPDVTGPVRDRALAAHGRLVAHLERAASGSEAPFALGGTGLGALMSATAAAGADLSTLAVRADAERNRLAGRLAADCGRIDPDRRPFELVRDLARDHPGTGGLLPAARAWADRAIAFTRERDLVPYHDGDLRVALAPQSRRWARAMTVTAAPDEPDNPSWFYLSPPDPSWPPDRAEDWLRGFSAITLPAMTVSQVAPGHFCRARAARRATGPVRRTLLSWPTVVGWAHYAEELCVDEGFCSGDPRFAIGVWLSALVRVTRLACAIGLHTGAMTLAGAVRRFEADTHLTGAAARAEAERSAFDPMAGRFTWGKLEILALRERARRQWGPGFTLRRFHGALLALGSPPLGLLGAALR